MQPTIASLQQPMIAGALACSLALSAASAPLPAVAAAPMNVVLDDSHSSIEYQGNWVRDLVPRALAGTLSRTSQPGAQAQLSFHGRTITLLYSRDVDQGEYEVSIDGQIVDASLSAYSQRTQRQVSRTWLVSAEPAPHTIVVKLLPPQVTSPAKQFDIDGFIVDMQLAAADTATDDQSSYIRYEGSWFSQGDASSSFVGTQSSSNGEGDFLWFPFEGDRITYHYYGDVNQGEVSVTIDGVPKGTFSLFDASRSARSLSFAGLGARPHVIHLTVTGSKEPAATGELVNVDHFTTAASASSLEYFTQEHSSPLYTDTYGDVPAATAKFHTLRVDLADSTVRVHPYSANGRNPGPATTVRGPNHPITVPVWDPRGENQALLKDIYSAANIPGQRAMISTDHFCDASEGNCGKADAGAPEGLFISAGTLFHANFTPGRPALLFEAHKVRIAQPEATEKLEGVANAVGGGPQILSGGHIACDTYQYDSAGLPDRCATIKIEPDSLLLLRSGACVAREGESLYLMATDVATPTTWYNLASFMRSLGCTEGMQFNGGDATGLIIAGSPKIVRSGEQEIGTGLIISRAQQCSAGVCFTPEPVVMPKSRE